MVDPDPISDDMTMLWRLLQLTKRKEKSLALHWRPRPSFQLVRRASGGPGQTAVSNLTLVEAIQGMNKNFDKLEEQARQTSCILTALSKAVSFNAKEIKD